MKKPALLRAKHQNQHYTHATHSLMSQRRVPSLAICCFYDREFRGRRQQTYNSTLHYQVSTARKEFFTLCKVKQHLFAHCEMWNLTFAHCEGNYSHGCGNLMIDLQVWTFLHFSMSKDEQCGDSATAYHTYIVLNFSVALVRQLSLNLSYTVTALFIFAHWEM